MRKTIYWIIFAAALIALLSGIQEMGYYIKGMHELTELKAQKIAALEGQSRNEAQIQHLTESINYIKSSPFWNRSMLKGTLLIAAGFILFQFNSNIMHQAKGDRSVSLSKTKPAE
jgi:hypothetical protein